MHELFVVIYLQQPREKYWGILRRSSSSGVWLTGVDLNTIQEWIMGFIDGTEIKSCLATTFFPMHRIEKISMDEARGEIPSLATSLFKKIGMKVEDVFELAFDLPEYIQ